MSNVAVSPSPQKVALPTSIPPGMGILAPVSAEYAELLTPDALEFVAKLQRKFHKTRIHLLRKRVERQAQIDAGQLPTFLPKTEAIRFLTLPAYQLV